MSEKNDKAKPVAKPIYLVIEADTAAEMESKIAAKIAENMIPLGGVSATFQNGITGGKRWIKTIYRQAVINLDFYKKNY